MLWTIAQLKRFDPPIYWNPKDDVAGLAFTTFEVATPKAGRQLGRHLERLATGPAKPVCDAFIMWERAFCEVGRCFTTALKGNTRLHRDPIL